MVLRRNRREESEPRASMAKGLQFWVTILSNFLALSKCVNILVKVNLDLKKITPQGMVRRAVNLSF